MGHSKGVSRRSLDKILAAVELTQKWPKKGPFGELKALGQVFGFLGPF